MKKNLLWMFAAILFCGAMTTSCDKDDDNNSSPTPPEETPSTATKYDVTLTLFTYKTISAYVDYEFSYTDHNGKESTPVMLTGNEKGETLSTNEAAYYKNQYEARVTESFPESKYLEYVAFHYTIKDVPKGSEISWKTIQHMAQGATAPTEGIRFVWPCVMVTAKAGAAIRNRMNIGEGIVTTKMDQWFENIIKGKEGREFTYATGSVTIDDEL